MRARNVAFVLTMPNVGSWNGRWSGEGAVYARVQRVPGKALETLDEKLPRNFYYDFGDGWGASVRAFYPTPQESRKLRSASSGFCGYDWMIREIIEFGRIKSLQERLTEERRRGAA